MLEKLGDVKREQETKKPEPAAMRRGSNGDVGRHCPSS